MLHSPFQCVLEILVNPGVFTLDDIFSHFGLISLGDVEQLALLLGNKLGVEFLPLQLELLI